MFAAAYFPCLPNSISYTLSLESCSSSLALNPLAYSLLYRRLYTLPARGDDRHTLLVYCIEHHLLVLHHTILNCFPVLRVQGYPCWLLYCLRRSCFHLHR